MNRHRGRIGVLAAVSALTLLAGCTGAERGRLVPGHSDPSGPSRSNGPAARPAADAAQFRALPHGAADGADQQLTGFAEGAGVVVAVGSNDAGGVTRPAFGYSTDDGVSWHAGRVATRPGASVNDSALVVVRRGDTFLAMGNSSAGVSVWTSRDGRSWNRRADPPTGLGTQYLATGLAVTSSGYVLVGHVDGPDGRSAPVAWTSPDGAAWVRHAGGTSGLRSVRGSDVTISSVAVARGTSVVAVGSIQQPGRGGEVPAVWRSADGGARWHRVPLPAGLGGGSLNSFFESVLWSGHRFVAVGSGGAGTSGHYAGLIATSADGRQWRSVSSGAGLTAKADVYLKTAVDDGRVVTAFGTVCTASCALRGVRLGGPGPAASPVPSSTEAPRMQVLAAFRTSRRSTLLAGTADPHGDDDVRLWRAGAGRPLGRVDVHALLPVAVTVAPGALATDGTRVVAVGSTNGLPVSWTSPDGVRFGAPTRLSRDPQCFVRGVVHGPLGWLAFGGCSTGTHAQGVTWASADAAHWRQSLPGELYSAGAFADSSVLSAVALPGRDGWAVVGSYTLDGDPARSALSAHSRDGLSWQAANVETFTGRPAAHGRQIPVYDLRGDVDGTRAMNAVSGSGTNLVAVGAARRSSAAGTDSPAAWTSDDGGASWRLRWLPLPTGASTASAVQVVTHGRTVVAAGTEDRNGVSALCSWVSPDLGRTWRAQQVLRATRDDDQLAVGSLLGVGSGFVLIGTTGRYGSAVPVVLRSGDGLHWSRSAADPRFTGGNWAVSASVSRRDRLLLLTTRQTLAGARSTVVALPG